MSKALKEARAAIKALEARQKELAVVVAAKDVGVKAAQAKVADAGKRYSRTPYYYRTGTREGWLAGLAGVAAALSAGYASGERPKMATVADILPLMSSGYIKVGVNNGPGVTVKKFLAGLRPMSKDALRRKARVDKAVQRAQSVLHAAMDKQRAEYTALYAEAPKFEATLADLTALAKMALLRWASRESTYSPERNDLARITNPDGLLDNARKHLAALQAGQECECFDCRRSRQARKRTEEEARERAALPTVTFQCEPCGKSHRNAPTASQYSYREGRNWPRAYCPVTGQWQDLSEKEAKKHKAA